MTRTRHARGVVEALEADFPAEVTTARIRESITLAEAADEQQPITAYAPNGIGAADYREFAQELLNRAPPPVQTKSHGGNPRFRPSRVDERAAARAALDGSRGRGARSIDRGERGPGRSLDEPEDRSRPRMASPKPQHRLVRSNHCPPLEEALTAEPAPKTNGIRPAATGWAWSPTSRGPIPGLVDRQLWEALVLEEAQRQHRYGHPTAIVLAELVGLDALVARMGPAAMNRFVPPCAEMLVSLARTSDRITRLTTSRFGLLLLETDVAGAAGSPRGSRWPPSFGWRRARGPCGWRSAGRVPRPARSCARRPRRRTAPARAARRTLVDYGLAKWASDDAGIVQSGSGGMTRSAVSPLTTAR